MGGVRPTSERARQAFFNIVAGQIEGSRFLDLFAGSGVFAFEALSRGASLAVAVDLSRRNVEAIRRSAGDFGVAIETIAEDVLVALHRLRGRFFDLIYADPPYDYDRYDDLLMTIATTLESAPDALVAIEHRRNTSPFSSTAPGIEFVRRAEYGEVWISLFRARVDEATALSSAGASSTPGNPE
jgi:16S rRNA (guanine966-N2)-methyltransferase